MDIKRLRDRGTIKWTAMMLPEHVAMLREAAKELEKVPKPILDEHEIQLLEERLNYAMHYGLFTVFTLWEEGVFREITGQIQRVDSITKRIHLLVREEKVQFKFDSVVNITTID